MGIMSKSSNYTTINPHLSKNTPMPISLITTASWEGKNKFTAKNQGTGSYPEPPHGWQRNKRRTARYIPFNGPCLRKASMA